VALIYNNEHRALAFFLENFSVRIATSGRYTPVYGANIITRLIAAHLFEVNSSTPEIRFIGACKGTQGPFFSGQAQLPGGKSQGN
jgi:hypothetical protein